MQITFCLPQRTSWDTWGIHVAHCCINADLTHWPGCTLRLRSEKVKETGRVQNSLRGFSMFIEKKSGQVRPDAGRLKAESFLVTFFLLLYLIPFKVAEMDICRGKKGLKVDKGELEGQKLEEWSFWWVLFNSDVNRGHWNRNWNSGRGGEGDLRIPREENPWRWKAKKYPFCWDSEHLSYSLIISVDQRTCVAMAAVNIHVDIEEPSYFPPILSYTGLLIVVWFFDDYRCRAAKNMQAV